LRKAFGVEAELVPGSHGVFDVIADGVKVYSKDATGRFPEAGEVPKLLRSKK
jgi:predicted Rdx family selenoprotein